MGNLNDHRDWLLVKLAMPTDMVDAFMQNPDSHDVWNMLTAIEQELHRVTPIFIMVRYEKDNLWKIELNTINRVHAYSEPDTDLDMFSYQIAKTGRCD